MPGNFPDCRFARFAIALAICLRLAPDRFGTLCRWLAFLPRVFPFSAMKELPLSGESLTCA